MKTYWQNRTSKWYRKMKKRHEPLWPFIHNFIKEKNIQSILEIGGGLTSLFDKSTPVYQNIDLNEDTDAIHEDWTTMDVSPFIEKYDLILACAVIEHCESYEDFIKQVIKARPKYAIITFFLSLNRDINHLIQETRKGVPFWQNKYCLSELTKFMDTQVVKYEIVRLGRHDDYLLIDFND